MLPDDNDEILLRTICKFVWPSTNEGISLLGRFSRLKPHVSFKYEKQDGGKKFTYPDKGVVDKWLDCKTRLRSTLPSDTALRAFCSDLFDQTWFTNGDALAFVIMRMIAKEKLSTNLRELIKDSPTVLAKFKPYILAIANDGVTPLSKDAKPLIIPFYDSLPKVTVAAPLSPTRRHIDSLSTLIKSSDRADVLKWFLALMETIDASSAKPGSAYINALRLDLVDITDDAAGNSIEIDEALAYFKATLGKMKD